MTQETGPGKLAGAELIIMPSVITQSELSYVIAKVWKRCGKLCKTHSLVVGKKNHVKLLKNTNSSEPHQFVGII